MEYPAGSWIHGWIHGSMDIHGYPWIEQQHRNSKKQPKTTNTTQSTPQKPAPLTPIAGPPRPPPTRPPAHHPPAQPGGEPTKGERGQAGTHKCDVLCFYCFVVPRVLQCRCKLLRHAPLQACGLLYIGPGRDQARTWRTTVKSKTDKKREGEHLKEHLIPRLHAKDKKRPPK